MIFILTEMYKIIISHVYDNTNPLIINILFISISLTFIK
jgi:hypothetical protein